MMPGLRMPSADECLRREFQSVLSDNKVVFLSDMADTGAGESRVLIVSGGGDSNCLIQGD